MKTRRQKKKQILIVFTTVTAMLMMMMMINNMPIANSLASSASNSLMQRRSLTSLSSLSYYATIGSATNIGGDEIEIPRPLSTRMQQQQQHNASSYPLVEVLGVVSDETEDGDDPTMIYNSATATSTSTSNNILINTWNKIKSSMKFDKQAIIGLGFDFGLTYNFISNINGSITLSVAWYIASMKTGLSPLAPGNWRALLAAYASMYVIVCFLRPVRIALALGATHRMERFLQYMQQRIGCKRPIAIFVTGVLGFVLWATCAAIGVTLASTLAGVPLWRYDYIK